MRVRAIALDGNMLLPKLVGVMVLLDRSGSMSSIASAMEQAWTKFVADQRAISPDGMWVTVHQFDGNGYDVVYDRTELAKVGALGLAPRGSTPLRTSMARFLTTARGIVDDPNDPTERLLVVFITDGGETEHPVHPSWAEIREQIQGIESENCELIWLGTDAAILEAEDHMPAFAQPGATFTYAANSAGTATAGAALSYTVGAVRSRSNAKYHGKAGKVALREVAMASAGGPALDPEWLQKASATLAKAKTDRGTGNG